MIGRSLHRLFKLDVKLSSGKDLPHLGDRMLQEVFVKRMCDLQPADERKRRDFFTTIGDFGYLNLEKIDVRLETVSLPHLDGEEMMAISLGFLARGILGIRNASITFVKL